MTNPAAGDGDGGGVGGGVGQTETQVATDDENTAREVLQIAAASDLENRNENGSALYNTNTNTNSGVIDPSILSPQQPERDLFERRERETSGDRNQQPQSSGLLDLSLSRLQNMMPRISTRIVRNDQSGVSPAMGEGSGLSDGSGTSSVQVSIRLGGGQRPSASLERTSTTPVGNSLAQPSTRERNEERDDHEVVVGGGVGGSGGGVLREINSSGEGDDSAIDVHVNSSSGLHHWRSMGSPYRQHPSRGRGDRGDHNNSSSTSNRTSPGGVGRRRSEDNARPSGTTARNAASPSTADYASAAPPGERLDLNVVLLWLEQALPFLLILFCFFLKEHFLEIWFLALHSFAFVKSNQIVKRAITHRGGNSNSAKKLTIVTSVLVFLGFVLLFVVFPEQKLWLSMALMPPKEKLDVWHSFFRCALCDVTLRHFGVIVKATQLLLWKPKPGRMFRRQGHLLTFVEHTTILYSLLIPVPIWYRYFQNAERFGQVFSSVSTGCYLTMKLSTLFEKVVHFLGALKVLLQPVDQYGIRASKEDVVEIGDVCSICQDHMTRPLKLRCKHIFCEDCIGEWLDRDTTCPLCRAVVKPEVVRSFSDGSSGWILQVF